MGIIRTWLNDHDFIDRPDRNEVLEEVAKEFDKMKSLRWLMRRVMVTKNGQLLPNNFSSIFLKKLNALPC